MLRAFSSCEAMLELTVITRKNHGGYIPLRRSLPELVQVEVIPVLLYYIPLWIQTPPEKILNPPNHTPNTS